MASEYYTIPLIQMLIAKYNDSPSKETIDALALGILNYYFPQSLDYAIEFRPRCQYDLRLKVDLIIRRWYPETAGDYVLANQALVDIKLDTGTFGEEDCEAITKRLSLFVKKDDKNGTDCWFILFHGMYVRFYLWKDGEQEDEEGHSVISYPLEDDGVYGRPSRGMLSPNRRL